jgi:uncharacterized membrane-anchored protein YjiN (DUF445 family)
LNSNDEHFSVRPEERPSLDRVSKGGGEGEGDSESASIGGHRQLHASLPPAHRNHIGTVSLLITVAGAVASHIALTTGPFADAPWLRVVAAGFEAGLVGGLADWFAVTALFRHPLGLPIPHTAIIPARRAKIIESIVSMVEEEWLSPEVIGARLARFAPSALIVDWLRDPAHVERLGGPVRDLLRGLARTLSEGEVVEFVDRTIRGELRALPIDASAGHWLSRLVDSPSAAAAFQSAASSLGNLARKPGTADTLQAWLDRTARQLYKDGKRLVPLLLRRKIVQRKVVEATCDYASAELLNAAAEAEHPLRQYVFGAVRRFTERLGAGDAEALGQIEQLRTALVESLEAGPLVRDLLAQLRQQIEHDLDAPDSGLSELIDRKLRDAVLDLLDDPDRRTAFDQWVRTTADDLLRRHHHQIGLTVRENLEALDTDTLVARIEDRVGADLQFIRLNGALVGGLIGVLLALMHMFLG